MKTFITFLIILSAGATAFAQQQRSDSTHVHPQTKRQIHKEERRLKKAAKKETHWAYLDAYLEQSIQLGRNNSGISDQAKKSHAVTATAAALATPKMIKQDVSCRNQLEMLFVRSIDYGIHRSAFMVAAKREGYIMTEKPGETAPIDLPPEPKPLIC